MMYTTPHMIKKKSRSNQCNLAGKLPHNLCLYEKVKFNKISKKTFEINVYLP
jgi:hypothetical protein